MVFGFELIVLHAISITHTTEDWNEWLTFVFCHVNERIP